MEAELVNGIINGLLYAMFAVGLVLIFGVLRVINFAHGAIFAFAGIAAVWAVRHVGGPAIPVALVAGVLAGFALGGLTHLVVMGPVRRLGIQDHLVPAVATVGLASAIEAFGRISAGANPVSFPDGSLPTARVSILGASVSDLALVSCILAVIALVGLDRFMWVSRTGRQIRAVTYSDESSELLGINSARIRLVVLIVSTGFAGLAGVTTSMTINLAWPNLADGTLVSGFFIIVLGGLGSVRGAIVGGLLLGIVQSIAVYYSIGQWQDVVTTGLMFAVLLIRPNGLFGRREVLRF